MHFEHLKLKKLITTHYQRNEKSYALIIDRKSKKDKNGKIEFKTISLQQDGDFRSDECISFLKESDIVVTNPPFSLFREYIKQLMDYDKKFIIIAPQDAIKYKEVFPLFKSNKLRIGHSYHLTGLTLPNGEKLPKSDNRVRCCCWFTNLPVKRKEDFLNHASRYYLNKNDYPKYANYDAINVDKTEKIPLDYEGVMGVPITYLQKHNPNQFEILELCNNAYINENDGIIRKLYARIFIKNKRPLRKGENYDDLWNDDKQSWKW